MNPSQLPDMIFSTILVLLYILAYFLIRALFAWLASSWGKRRTLSSRETSTISKCSVALVPNDKARTHRSDRSPAKEESAIVLLCLLPEDLSGRVACFCGFQGVGNLSACCQKLQSQVWESREVWITLSASAHLTASFARAVSAWDACKVFRQAAFRTDLVNLRRLVTKNRPLPILEEAAHVACGLLPGDLSLSDLADFIRIGSRCLEAHDPESPAANQAAERLLRASRRCMELFTEEQLEHLEYAYKAVHQLHALMISSMQDSYEAQLQNSRMAQMCAGPPDPDPADSHDFKELPDLCND